MTFRLAAYYFINHCQHPQMTGRDLTILNATEEEDESNGEVSQPLLLPIVHRMCRTVAYRLEIFIPADKSQRVICTNNSASVQPTLSVSN